MTGISILGTGRYLPDRVVSNEEFTAFIETSDEWISSRTGISKRHFADGETTWRMGAQAAQAALDKAGVKAEEIDLIVGTTVTADYQTPSMACVVQHAIGAANAYCFDINAACSAFVYALDLVRSQLACGGARTALIVSSEMLSRLTDFADRTTCVLFGDGAGACVVRAEEKRYASCLGSDGSGYGLIFCKNPPPASPFRVKPDELDDISSTDIKLGHLWQNGREVYKFATKIMPEAVHNACVKAGVKEEDLAYIIPHQANARIVQAAMKNMGLPMEKAWLTIEHTGNTSSASIPIALDELAESGKLKRGDLLCAVGFGAGLTYGAAVFEW